MITYILQIREWRYGEVELAQAFTAWKCQGQNWNPGSSDSGTHSKVFCLQKGIAQRSRRRRDLGPTPGHTVTMEWKEITSGKRPGTQEQGQCRPRARDLPPHVMDAEPCTPSCSQQSIHEWERMSLPRAFSESRETFYFSGCRWVSHLSFTYALVKGTELYD